MSIRPHCGGGLSFRATICPSCSMQWCFVSSRLLCIYHTMMARLLAFTRSAIRCIVRLQDIVMPHLIIVGD